MGAQVFTAENCRHLSCRRIASNNLWHQKGEELNKLYKYDKAISCFKNALKIDYESSAVGGIGNAFAYKNNLEEAITWYDESIRLDPNDSITWSDFAQGYVRTPK